LKEKKVPPALNGIVTQTDFEKAQAYNLDKSRFGFFSSYISQVEITVVLLANLLPWFWNFAGQLLTKYGYGPEYEVTHSIVFTAILYLISTLTNIPLQLYYVVNI